MARDDGIGAQLLGLTARKRDGTVHLWRHDIADHGRALLGDSRTPSLLAARRGSHWSQRAPLEKNCRDGEAGVPRRGHAGLVRRAPQTRLRRVHVVASAKMLRRIVALRPSIAILSSYDHYMPPDGNGSEWRSDAGVVAPRSASARIQSALSSAGVNTVVIRGTPNPGFGAPACLSRAASAAPFKRRCDYDRAESLHPLAIRGAQNDAARGLDHIRVRRRQRPRRLPDRSVLGGATRQHRLPRR